MNLLEAIDGVLDRYDSLVMSMKVVRDTKGQPYDTYGNKELGELCESARNLRAARAEIPETEEAWRDELENIIDTLCQPVGYSQYAAPLRDGLAMYLAASGVAPKDAQRDGDVNFFKVRDIIRQAIRDWNGEPEDGCDPCPEDTEFEDHLADAITNGVLAAMTTAPPPTCRKEADDE